MADLVRHDDISESVPATDDKIFFRDVSDTGTALTDGIGVATVDQLAQGIAGTTYFPQQFTSTVDPTENEDITSGYKLGDNWVNTTTNDYFVCVDASTGAAVWSSNNRGVSGYEFTGGFADRTTGQSGASDLGSNVSYTQTMADNDRWLRFGFSSAQQLANDVPYWTDPTPAPAAGIGLFGGSHMPGGVTSMFDFTFNAATYSDAVETGGLQYTAADGSLDFTECLVGDLALVRFDFNLVPQIDNTTVEVGLIWQTRASDGTPTFTFALTGEPLFYGTNTAGRSYLNRPLLSAYFASNEDVRARALPAIRADNPVLIQPLTILNTIQR